MAWKFAAGAYLNALNRPWNLLGAVTPYSVTPTASATAPITGVNDRWSHIPFQWGSDANPQFFEVDLNVVASPGLNSSGEVSVWTGAQGSFSSVQKEDGAGSMIYTGGAPIAVKTQDVLVETGRPQNLRIWLYSDGTSIPGVKIRCLDTGRYLQAGGGSWGTDAVVQSRSTSGGLAYNIPFTPEVYNLVQRTTQRLQVILYFNNGSGTTTAYWDNPTISPQVNYAAVIGHNLNLGNRLYVDGADTSWSSLFSVNISGGSAGAGYTSPRPNFGGLLGADKGYRYYRCTIEDVQQLGAVYGQQGMGEFILAYVKDFACVGPQPGVQLALPYTGQIRYDNRAGAKYTFNVNKYAPRKATIKFFCGSVAEGDQIRDEIHVATEGGRYAMLLVPDVPAGMVAMPLYGMIQDVATYSFETADGRISTVELVLEEEPTPSY